VSFISFKLYREDFYFVDYFSSSALHGDRRAAGCESHTNSANQSACLVANNIWIEGA
jgi:hypothetical protein